MTNNSKPAVAMFSVHSDPLAPLGAQETGGQNIYIYSLVNELDKKGWPIDVFTRWDDAHKNQVVSLGKRSRVIRLTGGPLKYIPRMELMPILEQVYQSFLNFISRQNPYALFHGHYWDGGWLALKARRQFDKPLVQNFHSMGKVRFQTKQKYLGEGNEQQTFEQRFQIEQDVIDNASAIISLAEAEKQDLNLLYNAPLQKVKVIPGGVNLAYFKTRPKDKARALLGIDAKDFVVLFVGRLEWRKGIGTLISAAKLLRPDIPNLKILIVGGRIHGRQKNIDDHREYKRLVKKSGEEGVQDIVRFMGRIDHGRLPWVYSAADVFAIPSYYEPFGLVALEAMACKVPTVASDTGGLAAIIQENRTGLLFQPRNPLAMSQRILQIHRQPQLAEQLTQTAWSEIQKNYSWKAIAQKIEQVYLSLSNHAHSAPGAV